MKNLVLLACLFFLGIFFLACQPDNKTSADSGDQAADTKPAMTKADSIKRGEYFSNIQGCNDCHTPKIMTDHGPVPDPSRLLSGHPSSDPLPKITDKAMIGAGQWVLFTQDATAVVGPWGTSFTANLTPDETGLGNWTLENFDKALRHGKFKGLDNGRMILPPMPWPSYSHMSDEDLSYLWTYLRSIKPIKNVVPAALPPG